ncbi:acetylcholine receptor subunit alpha-1-B-like [Montipora foliosa]|uniref:acetylcholine receptor subunit alpha-1-B-like n=1 Tax=Montipora foliosa TaxID=591990 RepID=UPI0035F19EFC
MRLFLVITLLCFCATVNAIEVVQDGDYEEKLANFVTRNSKDRRPVLSIQDKVTVVFGITLNQIVDVVERNQILKLSLFIRQKWVNPLLRWNVSENGGIQEINVDPSRLWKPDIYLYNNADEDHDGAQDKMQTKIKVDYNGTNRWLAPSILKSSCKINVRYFPFDEQHCELKFGSWTYDANRVDIVTEGPSADTKTTQVNGEWDLVDFPCQRNELYYECCPNQPYSDVTCTLSLRRRTMYFFVNLIVPCLLITLLSLLSFFLPSEAGERITLVITNMLALTVFMLIVADILPATSEVVPLISIYFTSILIEVGLSLIATVVVLKCYFSNPSFSEIPFWIRLVVIQGLGQLLKIEVKRQRQASRGKDEDKKAHKRHRSLADAQDPYFDYCHQDHTSHKNSEGFSQTKRFSTADEPDIHKNISSRRNNETKKKCKQHVAATEGLDGNFNLNHQNVSCHNASSRNAKSKRPVSMAESIDPNFELYHQSHSSRRNTACNVNDLGVPPCGACHELTVEMLHLGSGFPLKNVSKTPSRPSLRRESCYDTLCDEKADTNVAGMSQTPLISALLHRQEHLVAYVKELVRAVEEQDEHDSKKEEWILVAEILDKFFLYLFVIIMIGSTVLIFSTGTSW